MPAGPHPADSLNHFQPDLGIPYDSISSGSALDSPFVVFLKQDGTKQLVDRPKRVMRWWRVNGSGNCYLILRYGNKILSPIPDKGAIALEKK